MSSSNSVIETASQVANKVDSEALSPTLILHNSSIHASNHLPSPSSGKRYLDHGVQQIIDDAAKAVKTLRSLPAGQKETFASGFHKLTAKLQARTNKQLARCQAMPAELPDPLPQPNVLFKPNRKRGYTGAQAAEENKKDARRAQKQAERDAKDQRRKNESISRDLRQEHIACHKEAEEAKKTRRRKKIQEYTINVIARQRQQGLVAPSPAPVNLATSSSNKLSDPPITQVVSENKTESDSSDDSDNEVILSSYPPKASTSIQVPATTPTSTRSSIRSKKHTRKFESQHAQDIAVVKAKEERRKQQEAKTNRTGTGRTKAAEALAQTSQLLDGVELPFRSSQ
jgi:hypothetical protein